MSNKVREAVTDRVIVICHATAQLGHGLQKSKKQRLVARIDRNLSYKTEDRSKSDAAQLQVG